MDNPQTSLHFSESSTSSTLRLPTTPLAKKPYQDKNISWVSVVELILEEDKLSRNDANRCYRKVLAFYGHSTQMPLERYLGLLENNTLPPMDYIKRAWRGMQKRHPHLRGSQWDNRQKHAGVMREKVHDIY